MKIKSIQERPSKWVIHLEGGSVIIQKKIQIAKVDEQLDSCRWEELVCALCKKIVNHQTHKGDRL